MPWWSLPSLFAEIGPAHLAHHVPHSRFRDYPAVQPAFAGWTTTMDEPAFPTYVGQVLVPDLRTNDVMVLDNLPAHKVAGVRDAIRRLERLYLPPYSPDLNPIKQLGAKINTLLALAQLAPPPSARSQAR